MALELEPNRTGLGYEKLMCAALEALVPADQGLVLLPSPPRPKCGPIHLHTLNITISPLFEPTQRSIRAPVAGHAGTVQDGRSFSVVSFFNRGSPVARALQRLNVDFLRINVHVNSVKGNRGDGLSDDEVADSDSNPGSDSDSDTFTSASVRPKKAPKRRHLETTIDLRYLSRHMETLRREGGPIGRLWANDVLMQQRHRELGVRAEETLANLRQHIHDACVDPETALREGIWEDHSVAERRRREQKAKEDARFDADAYDTEDDDGDEGEGRIFQGMNSLIISIDRVNGELRAYRA